MFYQPNKPYPVPTKKTALKLLIPFLFFFFACKQHDTENPGNPAHSQAIIDKVNDLLNGGQLKQAINYLDSAYHDFPNLGRIDVWRKYNIKTNYYLYYERNLTKERLYADSMLFILKGKEQLYKTEYASSLFAQGDVLMAEKKYAAAFKCYYDGKLFAEKNLDSCSYSQFTYQLGMVRYQQGNYLRAIPYFKQAFTENHHCKDNSDFGYLFIYPQSHLNTIALSFEKSGMLDSSIYYYRQALRFIDRNAWRFPTKSQFVETARGVIYGNLGGVYGNLNNYPMAEKYLKASIRINKRPGYAVQDAQTAQLKLAALYIQFGHFAVADTLIMQIEHDLFDEKGEGAVDVNNRLKLIKLKWAYYDKTHKIGLAYQYMQQYERLRDSLDRSNKELKASDIDEGFKNTEQQYRLALLNKNDQLKNFYLLSAVLIAIMAISILLLIWYHLKRYREAHRQISEQHEQIIQQNQQMQQALTALEQSQEDNTRMMQIVAHDLRNPIGGMFSIASLMLEDEDIPDDRRMMLELIKTSGRNSLELVSDLLQVHIKAEKLRKEPVDLGELLQYCVDLLRYKAEAKAQQIQLDVVSYTLLLSREKMWRVISNLIANAIKFSPTGSVVKVQLIKRESLVLIAVEDQGIGIPQELKDKIFDMFTEAKRPGTSGEQPYGMGLAISKQIVGAHDGRLWFESKPGGGTTFFMELPIIKEPVA